MKSKLLFLLTLPLVLSGCTSHIAATYDNFNETFDGYAVYDPAYGRASIELVSDKNGTICVGSTPYYQGIARYNFNIVCSDGRMITGNLYHGQNTGRAFTNRNETLSFSVHKLLKKQEIALKEYRTSASNKPNLDNKKQQIPVVMQPNNF